MQVSLKCNSCHPGAGREPVIDSDLPSNGVPTFVGMTWSGGSFCGADSRQHSQVRLLCGVVCTSGTEKSLRLFRGFL